MKLRLLLVFLGMGLCQPLWAQAQAAAPAAPQATDLVPTFRIGDRPPPLAPMAWIKGGPVARFEPGRVYVVKFFATWCGASRQSMPELSALARRHAGRLTAIGVNVREGERGVPTVEAVTEFVNARGEEMDYIVAMDDPVAKPLFESWMVAAGAYGTPTAFVIGRDGRLAYVGFAIDPASSPTLEEAVKQALAGTSDLDAARRLQAQVNRQTAEYLQDKRELGPLRQARERRDYRAVLAEADKLVARLPHYEARVFFDRLGAMLHVDEPGALAFAQAHRDAAADAADAARRDANVGRIVAAEKQLSPLAYRFAAQRLEAALAADDAGDYGTLLNLLALAGAYRDLGETERAIAAQERAVALARGTREATRDALEHMQRTPDEYRQAGARE